MRGKMSKKIKFMIYVACTLWIVVFAQIAVTRIFVSQTDVTQAFARNQLVVEEGSSNMTSSWKSLATHGFFMRRWEKYPAAFRQRKGGGSRIIFLDTRGGHVCQNILKGDTMWRTGLQAVSS